MMKAIQILKRRNKAFINDVQIPKRKPHETLVEIHYSPVHPADLATMVGQYPEKEYPLTLGLEASGVIIESPKESEIGQKVSCYSKKGTWAQYIIPDFYNMYPEEISLEKASTLFVNPLTALIMQQIVNNQNFIINAANSSLASILIKNSPMSEPICIVRNVNAKDKVFANGGKVVLDTSIVDFRFQLDSALKTHPCNIGFDLIGGHSGKLVFDSLQNGGVLYCVGMIGEKELTGLDSAEFIFNRKTIKGIHLNSYLNPTSTANWFKEINILPHKFVSSVDEVLPYDQFAQAAMKYSKKLGKGKILLKFK